MNFAIIGCGFIANKHVKAIENIKNAKLVAVCDMDESRMEPFISTGVTPYTNAEEMLLDESIDVVSICTPTGSHSKLAELVAKHKKHIILEKPMALKNKDAENIIEVCKDNNVKLSIVHPNRYRPVVLELKNILDKGLLGKISHANCTVRWNRNQEYYDQAPWRGTKEHDGGVLMNQAIHNLDLLLWFMGNPEKIYSMAATRYRRIEAEDVSVGVITFESGALGVVEAATTIYPKNFEESISIFGENGTVKIGGPNALYFKHLEIEGFSSEETNQIIKRVEDNPFGKPGHQHIIEDMIESINTDKDPAINGDVAYEALKLVNAFYESAEQNKVFDY